MSRKKSLSTPVSRARPKKLKDLPQESTENTIFPKRNYNGRTHSNDYFHNPKSYIGVIGLGQTQVKRGDREEFKSLDLTHSVRIRQRNRTHAKRHSHTRYLNQPEVSLRKPPVGETRFPSVHMSNCRDSQPASITIGLDVRNSESYIDYESARGDEWLYLMSSHIPSIANTSYPHVDCTLPSIALELGNLIDQGNRDLFAGSTANFNSSSHLEDLPHPSYQGPSKAWNGSSHAHLEFFQKWDTHDEEGGSAHKNIDGYNFGSPTIGHASHST